MFPCTLSRELLCFLVPGVESCYVFLYLERRIVPGVESCYVFFLVPGVESKDKKLKPQEMNTLRHL